MWENVLPVLIPFYFCFMGTHIVIDGYNLILQSSWLMGQENQQDLQANREALVEALSVYKKYKPFKITVVFDGKNAPLDLPRSDRRKGITLRFSYRGELADTLIKRIVARDKQKALVITSDNEIVQYALCRGATVMSSEEFDKRLMTAQLTDGQSDPERSESVGWEPTTKKKGPARRLPKWRRRMSRKLKKL
ncbi:MAG: NYN domain-containing protein [Desulfobacteraceae bacterium]|nr:NYN domain-containing protein [Desulfobacteraceae bacterium]